MRRLPIVLGLVVLIGFLLLNSIFRVDEREKAMVLQFGQVRAVKENPGLAFKIPFIQNVVYYDCRIQGLDTNPLEVTPLDDRRLIVDAFARWRISDVQQFRRAVGVGGMSAATQRLEAILNANVREQLGAVPLRGGAVGRPGRADEPHPRPVDRGGARARRRHHRRAAQARRPARAEPRGDLQPDEGRARARGRRRARPRQRGGAAPARPGRPHGDRDRLGGASATRRSSAASPTPSATASSPRPSGRTRSSSPSCDRWTPTGLRLPPRTRR